jgi:hypothetical protein
MTGEHLPCEGQKTEKEIKNEYVFILCPSCSYDKALWQERILLEGSIQNYHLVHTEVEDVYRCAKCRYGFSKWRTL